MNLCVLRSGGDFKPEHAQRLAKMVPDLVCLSDCEIEGVKTIPLKYDWQGWWAKMELYRPDIKGDLLYFDLDTTVYEIPDMPKGDIVLTDFGDQQVIGSGLMRLTQATRERVWRQWITNPAANMARHMTWPAGDQGFLLPFLRHASRWQNFSKVYSYKIHCKKGIPDDAQIVCFHGKPRPWDLET